MQTFLCSPMGQSFLLQLSLSLDFPIHLLPPYWGRGLLHSRVLLLTPPPHVTEQDAHGDQGPQPPSTNKTDKEETTLKFWVKMQKWSHKFSKIKTKKLNLISGYVECEAQRYEGKHAELIWINISWEIEKRSAQNTWECCPRGQPWCMKMFGCLPGMQR